MIQSTDWLRFAGGRDALRFAARDLATVKRALALVPEKRVCIQAGGCLGVYPAFLSKHFKTVYTFEASPTNYVLMRENVTATNVVMQHRALGSAPGGVRIEQVRRTKKGSHPHEGIAHVAGEGDIPVVRLDDLDMPVCDFLCLDLEGYELEALKGSVALLERCRPVLMIEVNPNCRHYGLTEDDVRRWLKDAGYRFVFRAHADDVYVPTKPFNAVEFVKGWVTDTREML